MTKHSATILSLLTMGSVLSGCASTIDRIGNIGSPPPQSKFESPTQQPGYQPISWPSPDPEPPSHQYANSLWQPGARAFFRDQRASRVGDILRVKVHVNDQAKVDNKTTKTRTDNDNLSILGLFGLEKKIPGKGANELGIKGATADTGEGKTDRTDKIDTQIAATITQVLPNGNYAIQGKQEISLNFDLREIAIQGIVRPQDIDTTNTVDSTQVAEARITYGGRGQLQDTAQPRWGAQLVDIVSPF